MAGSDNERFIMIGKTISHYPAKKQRDAEKRHKILVHIKSSLL